ncbi:hypothetical protein JB92DRAFT_3105602 [Gautieria morchelliformis]|nr:hypothetical protein JB92DRAFT_3105602 [Gautieria morchelliformis]
MDPENSMTSNRVKLEPVDCRINPLGVSAAWQVQATISANRRVVKPEPLDPDAVPHASGAAAGQVYNNPSQQTAGQGSHERVEQSTVPAPKPASLQPSGPLYTTYASVQEIAYTPEMALLQGVGMVKTIKNNIMKLELGSRMRKEVWLREVAGLENQAAPTTLIAVCGATGVGKSSLLNAILDDNIVPTSGMRVTEIAYHDKPTIDADVSFLTLNEWREELEVLLDDLVDEGGNVRRATDLRSEAGVAWHKVHAVYPSIDQDQLARMTVDQVIMRDPVISGYLSTTKHICSKDSKAFAVEISKYIDSKDQKRGQKKGKKGKDDKKKDKKKGKNDKDGEKKDFNGVTDNDPALWPLIRQVVIKCQSTALSAGAILVDLPGVADANAARSNICRDYMKKCDCIWVLAPITRAVDDRTAKGLLGDAFKIQLKMDGNYDDSAITFIATKADDISCSEVIRALKLEDDEDIEGVEKKISVIKDGQKKWKNNKAAADRAVKATEKELKDVRAVGNEYRKHLKALQSGESFQPTLTGKAATARKSSSLSLGKRKRAASKSKRSPKRRKSDADDEGSESDELDDEEEEEDDFIDDEDEIEDASDSDSSSDADSDSKSSNSGSDDDENSNVESDENEDAMEVEEEVTEESLKAKIEETTNTIKTLRTRLSSEKLGKKKAGDEMINAKDRLAKAQTEKNGICSLKRSEFSRDGLKEDFRTGLREIDEAEAQERDPESFDPTQQIRNYDDIDLPTFCVSARDYIRITKQVKGDGKPTCFTDVVNTGIPDLQEWCQSLTVSSRERAARTFLAHLHTFIASVMSYVKGITEVKETDRVALREMWQSQMEDNEEDDGEEEDMIDPFAWLRQDAWNMAEDGTFHAKKKSQTHKVNILGEPIGIIPRLTKDFGSIVDEVVVELKGKFEDGLNEKLQAGATNAAAMAVMTSDEFAASMHWKTYRATLRRDGSFRRCLNSELIHPLTKNIASSWARVFEADLFASFEAQAMSIVSKLLKEVENSAAPGLKDRSKQQGEAALEEVKVAMKSLVMVVRDILNNNQKEVSRCLVPHLAGQLHPGYSQASDEWGRGSVARQKAVFHNFITTVRNQVFNGGADKLLDRLSNAADSVGDALNAALGDLSQKVEVSMSVLWESPRDDPRQACVRQKALETLERIKIQVRLWSSAEKNSVS